MMEGKVLLVCIYVGFLGLLTAALGFAAEAKRIKSPHTGTFSGENIRLGSRGDSYYEYLVKVWLQQGPHQVNHHKYLRDMYEEAIKGVKHRLVQKSTPKGLVFVVVMAYSDAPIVVKCLKCRLILDQ